MKVLIRRKPLSEQLTIQNQLISILIPNMIAKAQTMSWSMVKNAEEREENTVPKEVAQVTAQRIVMVQVTTEENSIPEVIDVRINKDRIVQDSHKTCIRISITIITVMTVMELSKDVSGRVKTFQIRTDP